MNEKINAWIYAVIVLTRVAEAVDETAGRFSPVKRMGVGSGEVQVTCDPGLVIVPDRRVFRHLPVRHLLRISAAKKFDQFQMNKTKLLRIFFTRL